MQAMDLKRTLVLAMGALTLTAACGTTVPLSQQQNGGRVNGVDGGTSGVAVPGSVSPGGTAPSGIQAPTTGGTGASSGGVAGTGGPAGTSSSTGGGEATAGSGASAVPSGPLPATGPGWDKNNVYLGFPTENDASQAASTLGYSGINFGDMQGNVTAVVAKINAQGGLFGRRVVPVFHDNGTTQLLTDPNTAAQANCTYFTQDKRVVAVVNLLTLLDIDNFRTCMAKAKIPVFAAGQITDDVVLKQLNGLYLNLAASYTPYTPAFMARLKAQGFFSGWDFTQGKPNTDKPKVGVLIYSAGATEKRVGQLFVNTLKSLGYPPITTFEYTDVTGSQMPSAVLKFRNSGVTHVFDYTAAITQFMTTANQQGYRPRYALVSSMGPRDVIAGHVPDAQLVGSMGSGFCPVCEVPAAHDPNNSPGAAACRADLAKAGIRYEGEPNRSALGIAYATCDGFKMIVGALAAGKGLTAANLVAGLDRVGPGFPTARSFQSALSRSRPSLPALIRDFSWNTGCKCFLYGTGTQQLP